MRRLLFSSFFIAALVALVLLSSGGLPGYQSVAGVAPIADKAVLAVTLDDGSAYPNESANPPPAQVDVSDGSVQYVVSITSEDINLGPDVPPDSRVSFYADIPPDCWGRWYDPAGFFPFDSYTLGGDPFADPYSQEQWGTTDSDPNIKKTDDPQVTFEIDLHLQTVDYGITEPVGQPQLITRFFEFHCVVTGNHHFLFCNKIEPMPPYEDPDFPPAQWPADNLYCAAYDVEVLPVTATVEADLEKENLQLQPIYTLKCVEDWPIPPTDGLFTFSEDMSAACDQLFSPTMGAPLQVSSFPVPPPFNGDDDGDGYVDEDPKGDCNGDGSNDDDYDGLIDEDDGSVNTLWINCPAVFPDAGGRFVQLVRGFIGVDNDGDNLVDEDGASCADLNSSTVCGDFPGEGGGYDFDNNVFDYEDDIPPRIDRDGDTTIDPCVWIPPDYFYPGSDPRDFCEAQQQGKDDDDDTLIDEDPLDCLVEGTISQSGDPLYSECFYVIKEFINNNGPELSVPVRVLTEVDCPDTKTDGTPTQTECSVHITEEDAALYSMEVSAGMHICHNGVDDDGDTVVDDGCGAGYPPTVGDPESDLGAPVPMYAKYCNGVGPFGVFCYQAYPPAVLDCEAPKVPTDPPIGPYQDYPDGLTSDFDGDTLPDVWMGPGDCFVVDSLDGEYKELDTKKFLDLPWNAHNLHLVDPPGVTDWTTAATAWRTAPTPTARRPGSTWTRSPRPSAWTTRL